MSLSAALNIAQSALQATSRRTDVVARNLTNAQDPDYNRRSTTLVTLPGGGVRAAEVRRASDEMLSRQNLSAISGWSGQQALSDALGRLSLSVNGVDGEGSAAVALGKLSQSLQSYAAAPANTALGQTAVEAARDLVRNLNDASAAVQSARSDADDAIASATGELRSLLDQFGDANREVIAGTKLGRDTSDSADRRDGILKKIAELVPVSATNRGDGDMVLSTREGAVLFETNPRTVTFAPQGAFAAGTTGGAVMIDGVRLTADAANGGTIAGLLELRDRTAPQLQTQLDEIARGLVSTFRETDQSGAGLADRPGLFTWSGAPAMPAGGMVSAGLAGTITLNAAFDAQRGGNPALLRDGGANGAVFRTNTQNAAGFSGTLIALNARLDEPGAFSSAAGLSASQSLNGFAAASVGWLEGSRQAATRASEAGAALASRTAEALSNATGVNVDTEWALMLELEHSYEASARIIKTVDEMLATLMQAIG
ncbi:MAG: flagellar hook-associated protein FlgK [Mesorhizobium amorphae]|nr:MAG: flagellar hook-associated protein FlgK [Mesorhizobium amorphae]